MKNINAYLVNARNIAVANRNKPLCDVPEMGIGNKPVDDGNYVFTEEEMNDFVDKESQSKNLFRPYVGSEEFINNKKRYCLWFGDTDTKYG